MTAIHNSQFDRCVHRYGGHYKVSRFRCWDQWLAMGFAQLSYRESLRDIESYLHTQLDLKGAIPVQIHITDGKTHEVNWLDDIAWEPGSVYLMDRGYLDFERLFKMDQAGADFVMRAKDNLDCDRYVPDRRHQEKRAGH